MLNATPITTRAIRLVIEAKMTTEQALDYAASRRNAKTASARRARRGIA